ADCQASASAQGSASLECTPPKLDLTFDLQAAASGSAQAKAQATFIGHMTEIKARGAAIVQGATKLKMLLQGDDTLKIPAPAVQIQAAMEAMIKVDPTKFNVPAGKIPCVIPAFEEAGKVLVKLGTDLTGTIAAQAKFVGYITTGSA